MKFAIKDFFSKCDQIRSFPRIWSHLLKKSLNGKLHVFANYVHSSLAEKTRIITCNAKADKISRSSHPRCSMKKGVLRNFTKLTGKRLCHSIVRLCLYNI